VAPLKGDLQNAFAAFRKKKMKALKAPKKQDPEQVEDAVRIPLGDRAGNVRTAPAADVSNFSTTKPTRKFVQVTHTAAPVV